MTPRAGCLRSMQHAPARLQHLHGLWHTIRYELYGGSVLFIQFFLKRGRQIFLLQVQLLGSSCRRKEVLPLRRMWHVSRRRPRQVRITPSRPTLLVFVLPSSHAPHSFVHCDECGHCISRQSMENGNHVHKPGRCVLAQAKRCTHD